MKICQVKETRMRRAIADDFIDLRIDEKEALQLLQEKTGLSFDDADEYLQDAYARWERIKRY